MFYSGAVRWRTKAAKEVYDMFMMLKAGIKPWEVNGGFVYHSDLFYIRECQRLEAVRHSAGPDWRRVG